MNIHDFIYQNKTQLKEEDLRLALDNLTESTTKEDVMKYADATGIDAKHLYLSESPTFQYIYYKFPNYVEVFTLDTDSEFLIKDVGGRIDYQNKVFNNKAWTKYLLAVEGVMQMQIFAKIYPMIAPEERYDLLRYIYVQNDQGHNFITKDMWVDALALKPNKEPLNLPEDQEEFVIYRGVGNKSAKLNEALSWTLSYYVASKFSYKGDSEGAIHVAKVKKEDIIEYFDERDEEEIIVQPSKVYDLKTYEQYQPLEVYKELLNTHLIDEYNFYRNTFLEEDNFYMDSTTHGIEHTKRVLALSMALAYHEELEVNDRALLANAALYHDIGRETDGVEPGHGVKSYERLMDEMYATIIIDCQNKPEDQEYRLDSFSRDEKEILKLLIELHDTDDALIKKEIKEMPNKQKERFEKLIRIFKDADALDRIRLKDLDDRYFRTESAKHLTNFSWLVNQKF